MIEQMKEVFDCSVLPKIILNSDLDVVYVNSIAASGFGILSTKTGLKRLLNSCEIEKIKDGLKTSSFFHLEVNNEEISKRFDFIKITDENLIMLQVEDNLNMNERLGAKLTCENVCELMKNEFSDPAIEMTTNILLLKGRLRGDKFLSPYINKLENCVYKIRRAVANSNSIISVLKSVSLYHTDIVSLNEVTSKIAESMKLKYCDNGIIEASIIITKSMYIKSIMDTLSFLCEQISVDGKKHSCKIAMIDYGNSWGVEISRDKTKLSDSVEDVFVPSLTSKNSLNPNLISVKYISESSGGTILFSEKKSSLVVTLKFPKMFSDENSAMLMQSDVSDVEYFVKNVYAADFKYIENLMN